MNAVQLSEWEAYDRLDPIGTWRDDFRMAYLASIITNIAIKWNAGKKQVKLIELMEFMPQWDRQETKEVKKQSVEDMRDFLLSFAKAHNKAIEKKNIKSPPPSQISNRKRRDG